MYLYQNDNKENDANLSAGIVRQPADIIDDFKSTLRILIEFGEYHDYGS